jgi:hypothetical protein
MANCLSIAPYRLTTLSLYSYALRAAPVWLLCSGKRSGLSFSDLTAPKFSFLSFHSDIQHRLLLLALPVPCGDSLSIGASQLEAFGLHVFRLRLFFVLLFNCRGRRAGCLLSGHLPVGGWSQSALSKEFMGLLDRCNSEYPDPHHFQILEFLDRPLLRQAGAKPRVLVWRFPPTWGFVLYV